VDHSLEEVLDPVLLSVHWTTSYDPQDLILCIPVRIGVGTFLALTFVDVLSFSGTLGNRRTFSLLGDHRDLKAWSESGSLWFSTSWSRPGSGGLYGEPLSPLDFIL